MLPSRRTWLMCLAAALALTILVLPSCLCGADVAPQQKQGDTHLKNPFEGARFYRNVDYVALVNAAADRQGGALGAQMKEVAKYPTFLWLDRIAAVNGTKGATRSLAGHLD